ncbi:MAG: type II toxin-antitoxin system VapC family toxin [Hyphomicrobiaceae bacterium]
MLLLDTDHLSEFIRGAATGAALRRRLDASREPAFVSIITLEELNRGWLARISKARTAPARVAAYQRYAATWEALKNWEILPWSENVDETFVRLVSEKIRIGTMDLRFASVALAHNATLLTRNLRDFEKVPNLRVENWLD